MISMWKHPALYIQTHCIIHTGAIPYPVSPENLYLRNLLELCGVLDLRCVRVSLPHSIAGSLVIRQDGPSDSTSALRQQAQPFL